MQINNSLGFVVWGVKNGFQNNMYSYNLNETIKNSLIDIQELCMPHYSDFYSIERVGGDILVSLYDPTLMDYSGSRKAYIVFSIIFPKGTAPLDNVLDLLSRFKNYYKVESNGLPSQEIFHRKLTEFNTKISSLSNSSVGPQIGYKNYLSLDEVKEVFTDLDILDYRKIYFFDRPNSYVTNNPNFLEVTSLERKYNVQIQNYNPLDFIIKINGIPSINSEIDTIGQGRVEIKNLRKTDKIDIFRGGNQTIPSFYVKDQQLVTLPLPKIEHPSHFTIRNLDPSRYRVIVNKQEQPITQISGNELKVAISSDHVVVEIIDKKNNAIVQTHDTRIHKTYVMFIQAGNGTSPPPVNGGNSGGSSIGFTEEPPKKSKTALILTLCSVVLLAGLAITGWQLGWFGGEKEKPPVSGNGTKNTTPNVGSDNEGSNENEPEENKLVNPDGYTVKTGNESILTSKGLLNTTNNRFYRFFNGKWEYSEKTTSDQWKDVSAADKTVVLVKYFSINTAEQNKVIEAEKVKNDDPLVKKDEKGQDDKKKEEKDPCKAICAEITRLVGKVITKKSPELAKFKEDANKVINSECDCKGGQSNLKVKLSNL